MEAVNKKNGWMVWKVEGEDGKKKAERAELERQRRGESQSVYRYYAFCQLGSRMLRNNISLIAQSEGLLLLSTHKQNNITNNLLASVLLKHFV